MALSAKRVRIWPPRDGKKSPASDIENDTQRESTDEPIPSVDELGRTVRSTLAWWLDEYMYCLTCLAAATFLVVLLYIFNGQREPTWSSDIRLSTALIAIMSVYRLALKAIVETCVSQGAWIWVSGFRKGRREARLEDFKLFDDASRGLYGALVLLWRMKARFVTSLGRSSLLAHWIRHFACVGSVITILIQGFETFSSQMVAFTDVPTVLTTNSSAQRPLTPSRSETWHNLVYDSLRETTLGLSTKAAVYEGMISTAVADVPVFCETKNCTWPIFPSLAVCGICTRSDYRPSCNLKTGCSYSMPSGTSVYGARAAPFQYHFTVDPSKRPSPFFNSSSRATITAFDIMSATKTPQGTDVQAYECGLWFCLQSYNVTVTNGTVNRSVTAEWSKSELAPDSSAHSGEYVFEDIPTEMNVKPPSRYSVPLDSLTTLKEFIDKLASGNASRVAGAMSYDTDWIQAIEAARNDLDGWIARLALSLTNHIRLTGAVEPAESESYSGTAYIVASHVEVNWYWVAYPVSLMAFAFLYLLQTV